MSQQNEFLINHLSKEIELANHQLIEQRSKNNLWVAFGPFLILWGVVANGEALKSLRAADPATLSVIAVVAVISYALLGLLAATIETGIWERANHCRAQLARLAGLSPKQLVFPSKGLYPLYCIIFGALGVVFVGLGYLCYKVGPKDPAPSPPALAAPATSAPPAAGVGP